MAEGHGKQSRRQQAEQRQQKDFSNGRREIERKWGHCTVTRCMCQYVCECVCVYGCVGYDTTTNECARTANEEEQQQQQGKKEEGNQRGAEGLGVSGVLGGGSGIRGHTIVSEAANDNADQVVWHCQA